MKNILAQKPLIVKKSSIHGYGVFAQTNIQPQEVIEECHVLKTASKSEAFENYYFSLSEQVGLSLGFGSIYNHSPQCNATFVYDEKEALLIFTANRFIAKGEEILINYGKEWFSSRQATFKKMPWYVKTWRYLKGLPLRGALVTTIVFSLIYGFKYYVALKS